MFAKAYQIASKYTYPVIVLARYFDKTIEAGVGSFVFINSDGWFMTAAHVFNFQQLHSSQMPEIQQYHSQLKALQENLNLSEEQRNEQVIALNYNPKWLSNNSLWWGFDRLIVEQLFVLKENDLAIGRLANFNSSMCSEFPIFKNPAQLLNATSLCKLGFPFHEIKADFNEAGNNFSIQPGVLPIPRFPLEGIFTRNIDGGKTPDNRFNIKYIETSTPGLKGQSGGPIFDVNGYIWAIQSQTVHIPLGFSPTINVDGNVVQENQFLNVGYGVHIETILQFMDAHGVKYQLEPEFI
jgi:Trypsin-like peptidase domain